MTLELTPPMGSGRGIPAFGSREVQAHAIAPALRRQRWSLQGQAAGALRMPST